MGLDGVELVMDVEDHFGITITDDEALSARTVRDLVELCRQRILAADLLKCPSLSCFLALRRTVRDVMGDPSFRVRPRWLVAQTLPPAKRREFWRQLPTLLQTTPADLRRPRPLRWALMIATLLIGCVSLIPTTADMAILPLSICFTLFAMFLLFVATSSFRTVSPTGFESFGDITRQLVGLRMATKRPTGPDEAAILEELRPIIANALGVRAEKVVPMARFVEDLGA
jgi:acyl carrier protein